jgi:hypothetical protein
VRRTRLVGAQAELFPNWRYHAFVTDRVGTAVWLDQDHRRHATVELCIRDLKAGVGLRHSPKGKFAANAAWLVAATLAHNLLRAAALHRLRHLPTFLPHNATPKAARSAQACPRWPASHLQPPDRLRPAGTASR